MSKQDLAEWLAKVSWNNGKNTYRGNTLQEWVDYYMTLTQAELLDEYRSYGC